MVSFGAIRIDGVTHEHDVVIDRRHVRKRSKKPSKKYRTLVVGTGTGALPIMEEVKQEAKRRHIKLLVLPTAQAIEALQKNTKETNAILHVTC